LSRAVALALALTVSLTSCATYETSRNTSVVSGGTFALGMAVWASGQQIQDESIALGGVAVGTASLMVMMASAAGMVILPRRVEIALRIAHALVVFAEDGNCEPVLQRHGEVQELDELVYQVVLMEDPAVSECFGSSSSTSSSPPPRSPPPAPSAPAERALPAPASTSTVP
jgi:hypothetical protein